MAEIQIASSAIDGVDVPHASTTCESEWDAPGYDAVLELKTGVPLVALCGGRGVLAIGLC